MLRHTKLRRMVVVSLLIAGGILMWLAPEPAFAAVSGAGRRARTAPRRYRARADRDRRRAPGRKPRTVKATLPVEPRRSFSQSYVSRLMSIDIKRADISDRASIV